MRAFMRGSKASLMLDNFCGKTPTCNVLNELGSRKAMYGPLERDFSSVSAKVGHVYRNLVYFSISYP